MAFNIASVAIRLIAEGGQFFREMRRAENRLVGFGRASRGVLRTVGKGGFLAAITGGGAAAFGATRTNQALLDISRQSGASVEALQLMGRAAAEAGVKLEAFTVTARRLRRRASEAVSGGEGLREAFAELNIDADKFQKLDIDKQLVVLADRFKKLGKETFTSSRFFQLLDTEGQTLLQLLEGGAPALVQRAKELEAMGVASETAATTMDKLRARWARFASQVQADFNKIVEFVGTPIENALQALEDFANDTPEKKIEKMASELEALNVAAEANIAIEKKRQILSKSTRASTSAQAINRQLQFLAFKGAGQQGVAGGTQNIRSEQLERTNSLLGEIKSFMRNNATGNTVTFSG